MGTGGRPVKSDHNSQKVSVVTVAGGSQAIGSVGAQRACIPSTTRETNHMNTKSTLARSIARELQHKNRGDDDDGAVVVRELTRIGGEVTAFCAKTKGEVEDLRKKQGDLQAQLQDLAQKEAENARRPSNSKASPGGFRIDLDTIQGNSNLEALKKGDRKARITLQMEGLAMKS